MIRLTGAETRMPFYGQSSAVRTIIFDRWSPVKDSEPPWRRRTPHLAICLEPADQQIKTEQFERRGPENCTSGNLTTTSANFVNRVTASYSIDLIKNASIY